MKGERAAEAVLLIVVSVATAVVAFWERLPSASRNYPLSFLLIPSVVWAAFRFGRRAAATATLVMCAIAVWGTLHGLGPFVVASPNDSLLLLQAFMGIMTVTALVLAAVVSERERAEEGLRSAQDELEERIAQRTSDLSSVVESLRAETRERERAQERLRLSEVNLAQARVLAQIGSWSWDVAENRVTWSDELFRMFGLEPQSTRVTSEFFLSRVHPEDRAMIDAVARRSLQTGEPFGFEHRIVRPDGGVRWLHGLGQVVRGPGGSAKMHGTCQDITERRVAEAERKRLEQEILDVSNTEQQRLGQDLHDDLGQLLTGVAFMSKTLENKLAAKSLPEARTIAEIRALINQAIAKTRSVAQVLSPLSLETEGFMTAIQDLCTSAEKVFNASCVLESNEAVSIESYPTAMHLYRIVQEAISNAVRHGKADRIVISLQSEVDSLKLSVRDNGVGFPSEVEPHRGLGLRIMRYRADLLGGTIEIRSTGDGTAVVCSVEGLGIQRLDRPKGDHKP